jgi:hypothetical protein
MGRLSVNFNGSFRDINTIEVEGAKHQVYNLQGQKVGDSLEGLPKGIYIKDGKKHVVR